MTRWWGRNRDTQSQPKVIDLTATVPDAPEFWMLAIPSAGEKGNPGAGVGDISGLERELAKVLAKDKVEFEGPCCYSSLTDATKVAVALMKVLPELMVIPVSSSGAASHVKKEPSHPQRDAAENEPL